MLTAAFDAALAGAPSRLVRDDGVEIDLAVARWRRAAHEEDRWLLDRCTGSVLDLGCGPGRLVAALTARTRPVLGVDMSAVAQRQCRRRRAAMMRRDLFAPLPREGSWDHVLLADGNIGIGGDPVRLLARAVRLLRTGGTVLVETDTAAEVFWRGTVRVRSHAGTGEPLPWACAGAAALSRLAEPLGLRRTDGYRGRRSFVELTALRAAGPGFAAPAAAAG